MAFVLSRTPSLIDHANDAHTTPPNSSEIDHTDMGNVKLQKSRVEIHLDQQNVYLKGIGVDVEPTRISGYVAVYLTESTALKEITLNFKGKATLPNELSLNNAPALTYVICKHDWSFLEGDKHHSHTLKAGRHIFPFQLRIGGSLPSSIVTPVFGGASIVYRLRAHVVRAGFGFHHDLDATQDVSIIRSFAPEAMEYQHTLEIERTWPDKLMYSILLPHKAWAAGDKITAVVKCSPLVKGVCVLNVQTTIQERTKAYARSGVQESTRIVASVSHEIVSGHAVEVGESRPYLFQPYSIPGSPAGSAPPSRPISTHLQMNPASVAPSTSRSLVIDDITQPDTPPLPPQPAPADNDALEPNTDSLEHDPESADLVAFLSIDIPLNIIPAHTLEPINISHRVHWNILLLNRDGHTSELHCSLPVHLLDYRLLAESRLCSAPTRRLILGLNKVPQEDDDDVQLPSYQAHVRDRIANMYLPEAATMRVTNPWIAQRVSPTLPETPDSGVSQTTSAPASAPPFWPSSRSGRSTPLEAHLLGHLPHQPGSDSSTPLDWVNSELLLSLSGDVPPRLRSCSPPPETGTSSAPASIRPPGATGPSAELHQPTSPSSSRPMSGITSRLQSRAGSRASSPEGARNVGLVAPALLPSPFAYFQSHHRQGHQSGLGDTFLHGGSSSSRHLPTLTKTSMKPLSSFTPPWISRTPRPAVPTMSDLDRASPSQSISSAPRGGPVRHVPSPVRRTREAETGAELLHRAFTEVPDYDVASRGFIGGVPPLSSTEGLPSYDEAQRLARALGSEADLSKDTPVHSIDYRDSDRRDMPQATVLAAPSVMSVHSSAN